MPKKMEKALKKAAKKKGLKGDRAKAYVYGTMQEKTDWKPPQQRKKRKEKMDNNMTYEME